jgi:hypothetical protein
MKPLYPGSITLVSLFSGNISCMPGINQVYFKSILNQHVKQVFPVYAGTLERDCVYFAFHEPFYDSFQITGKSTKNSYAFDISTAGTATA